VHFSSKSFRDDIFPEDVILAHDYFPTGELQKDSVVMVHLDDGLIYTTASTSSKIARITKFGVYPANFTTSSPSSPIGSGGTEATNGENTPQISGKQILWFDYVFLQLTLFMNSRTTSWNRDSHLLYTTLA